MFSGNQLKFRLAKKINLERTSDYASYPGHTWKKAARLMARRVMRLLNADPAWKVAGRPSFDELNEMRSKV
jgi:hypothetical protein